VQYALYRDQLGLFAVLPWTTAWLGISLHKYGKRR